MIHKGSDTWYFTILHHIIVIIRVNTCNKSFFLKIKYNHYVSLLVSKVLRTKGT